MLRSVLPGLVACALATAPAGAATVGVYDGPDLTAVALAGSDAVVLRQTSDGRSQVVAVPRGGGRAQTVLTVNRMNFVFEDESRRLAGSAARVALIAEIEDARDRTVEWRVYSGPPRGPIGVVRALPIREAWVPALVDVDGDRVLIVEARPEPDGPVRAFLLDPAAGLVPIPWARASARPIEISGGFAAAAMAGPNRVAVLDLASGAELVTVPLAGRERGADLSLAPDGRVAVATQAGVEVAGPGAPARLVPGTKGLERVHLAGGTLSGIDRSGRAVALPVGGGRITALGPPTGVLVDAAGDASGYAWVANGCARVAAIPVSTAPRRSSDPCPTTEIGYASIASTRLRGRTITVPVRCVTAPRGVCRGTAIGRISEGDGKAAASGRFAIPVGKSREVKLRVTRAALAEFRREGFGSLVMDARIPNGRIGVGADGDAELTVHLPGGDQRALVGAAIEFAPGDG
jgi:DNA-binding beta-propeller fold protein YncE